MAKYSRQLVWSERLPGLRQSGRLTQADAAHARELLAAWRGGTRSDPTEFGATLLRLRRERGLTQRELAARSGLERTQIIGYETQFNHRLQRHDLVAIARGLGVPEAELTRFLPPRRRFTLIGTALQEFREQRGWTRKQLARRSGISFGLIAQYENGRAQPGPENFKKLAAALRVPQRQLRPLLLQRGPEKRVSPFGQLIRQTRLARGILQGDLARQVGVARSDLSSYETTTKCPSPHYAPRLVERLAAALDLDPEAIEHALSLPRPHPPTSFGRRVRELRLAQGLSQRQLAVRAGCAVNTIGFYENGRAYPRTPHYLSALAGALGVQAEEFEHLLPLLAIRPEPPPSARELRRHRLRKGWSLVELGRRVGMGGEAIRNYEVGKTHASYRVVAALAKTLGVAQKRLEGLLAPDPPTTPLGLQIRRRRLRLELSQMQLSALTGIQQAVLSAYELGRQEPTPRDLTALARALRLPAPKLRALLRASNAPPSTQATQAAHRKPRAVKARASADSPGKARGQRPATPKGGDRPM